MTISQHSETGGFKLFGFTVTRKKKKGEREREKEKKKRKALFYCGTEINTLKFRHILQIQLRTQLTVLRV